MIKMTVIFLLTLFLCCQISTCSPENQETGTTLTLKRNKTHVTVRIGDLVIPDIILDSGLPFDGIMIFNSAYEDSLDLTNAREILLGGAGNGGAATALMLDSAAFYLGTLKMENQRIIMLQGDIYKGFPSNGIIGYSVLGHYMTELDYDHQKMRLYEPGTYIPDNSWTRIPIYFKNNTIPWIDASVVIKDEPAVRLSMYIDYASGENVELLIKPEMKFTMPEETEEVYLGRGLSGDIHGRTGNISKLIIGPYELNNLSASFAEARVRSKQENADAILGNGSLKRFNLIFSYDEKILYLKPNKYFRELSR